MTQDQLDLLHRYLDHTITDENLPRLQTLLRESSAARHMLRTLATVDIKLQESAALDPIALRLLGPSITTTTTTTPITRSARFQWRPLTSAAAGLIFGMFCTSMVWAYVAPSASRAITLLKESFESSATTTVPGLPREPGIWSGDQSHDVIAEQNIQPPDGIKMLRFNRATFTGEDAKHSAWSDLYRLIDLRGQLTDTKSVLRLTADFNAIPFPANEAYSCALELCALETDLADAPQPLTLPWVRENSTSTAMRKLPLKGDAKWKKTTVEISVSPQTRYLLVHLAVLKVKPYPPTEVVTFSGHYLDSVKLELRTNPGTR